MNMSNLVLLGAGFLMGNPKARNDFFSSLQQLAGHGIDALNKMGNGGEPNVAKPTEPESTE